jgi:hypothetical protein
MSSIARLTHAMVPHSQTSRFDAGAGKNSGLAQHPVQDGRGHGEYSSELHGEIAHLPTPYSNVWWRYHLDR